MFYFYDMLVPVLCKCYNNYLTCKHWLGVCKQIWKLTPQFMLRIRNVCCCLTGKITAWLKNCHWNWSAISASQDKLEKQTDEGTETIIKVISDRLALSVEWDSNWNCDSFAGGKLTTCQCKATSKRRNDGRGWPSGRGWDGMVLRGRKCGLMAGNWGNNFAFA